MKYIFLPRPDRSQHIRIVRVKWGKPSALHCALGQSAPSIGGVKIADLMYLCFETTFELCWTIKFCPKFDKTAAETHELLKQAYGESALSYMQVTR